jgi:hypothetical protein
MPAARCMWPVLDPEIRLSRAVLDALADLPRLLALNDWEQTSDPRDWRTVEGVDDHNRPTLYLVCELDVLVTPRELRHCRWENVAVDAYGQLHQLELVGA